MIRKSAVSILLAASLALPGSILLAAPAFAAPHAQVAGAAEAPSNPTLLWTGGRSALVTWGAASDGVRYEVTIAGGDVQRTKVVDGASTTFSNLPLNHRYMASVVTIDASDTRSAAVLTNTVALGTPPASEAQATPSASSTPAASTSTPSQTTTPTPSSTPSKTPSTTPSISSAAPTSSSPTSSQPLPSQSSAEPAAANGDGSLIAQVQPAQWGIGLLIALATFALLMVLRRRIGRTKD